MPGFHARINLCAQTAADENNHGERQSAPFSITASNLSAGPVALKSVATAGGISTTSSVVNISVVTPVITSLSASTAVNNQFSFGYSANPGLRYVLESSSNLFDWTPLVTNVATGNPAFFTNGISESANFYRVGRLPNPRRNTLATSPNRRTFLKLSLIPGAPPLCQ